MQSKLSKQCSGACKLVKPNTLAYFYPTQWGLEPKCRECRNAERRKQWQDNTRHKKYNMSPDGYDQLMKAQDYACAICGEKNRILAIDHCHSTKRVRGLLCHMCNMSLGAMKDSVELLSRAIIYLEKGKE